LSRETPAAKLALAYREADREVRLRLSRVGCVLAATLMPAGSSLDYFVYPNLFWPFFQVRMISSVWSVAILLILGTHFGRRNVRLFAYCWVLFPSAAMAWMINVSEGAVSPYYAGLNIAMVGVCMLMPWTSGDAALTCTGIIVMYLVACVLHRGVPFDASIFFNNVYFLVLTGIICVTTCYLNARRRFAEFRLRHEIAARNRELAESYERLAELDRLKSEFFANISHELRTPLTLILSPVEDLLRRPNISEHAQNLLRIVKENSLRLLKLINDLLELVRLEEGRGKLDRELMALNCFVPGIVDSVRYLASKKGLELKTAGTEQPLLVEADPRRLEKVLLNLLINSIKFTPAKGSITTRWRREGESAIVEVEDTGIGIAKADLPHIFDRFRQADGSTTRTHQGAGIGLALARELAEHHAGRLEAHSELGHGTTLKMTLPLAGPAAARGATQGAVARPDPAGPDPVADVHRAADRFVFLDRREMPRELPALGSGAFSVLLVEDEPDMRTFVASILATECRVLQATDGESGLAMVRQHRPDLLLLDLMLPKMDGLDVCDAVKSDEGLRSTKVVLLTARSDEAAKIRALERGADDFLIKPFSMVELRTRLQNLLHEAKLEQELRQRNDELEDALARLQEAEAQLVQTEKMNALGNLAAGLLHEINNPLNYTLTALQLAQDAAPSEDEELKEVLADIGEGMVRIQDIVGDLRSFAHPSADSAQERFELTACLDMASRLASHEIHSIAVLRDTPPTCRVVGSKTQITHLLLNLLTNSAQALVRVAPDRNPEIQISARPEQGRLQVRVRDNGVGIEPESLSKIFNPFFTEREVGTGMGLGLSICHTIVNNHGGSISARSEPGKWTEISFDLPLAPEEH
jgi:signal transduction histidine kinase